METFTFLFTDVEGSTALVQRAGEERYAQALADYRGIIRSGLAAHDGSEVDTQGDGFFAVFSSPRAGAAAAAQMQQALAAHPWPGGDEVRARMGLHTGEASRTDDGLVGLDVHRAARLAAVGHGGQILLSETTAPLVRDALPAGATLTDLGEHQLRDLSHPERIFQLTPAGLPSEFGPLQSLGHPEPRHNLPAQPTTFVGRQHEVAEVRALAGSSRLVTLTGAGGAGKTRLALQVAAGLLDGTRDGVWLAELAAITDENAVPSAIAAAIGIAAQPGRAVLDRVVDALVPQDLLIVLDNCEHLIDACAKAADAILRHCPRVRLLATSREPLGIGGEAIYRVPSLSLPAPDSDADGSSDAVALFLDRARAQGTDLSGPETLPLVVSVCRRLDGLPLAIELAAARLRSLSLASLSERLDQRFRLLTGGSRTALPRQQTLRATVDWSYSLLNQAEQALLRRLSVFIDGFDLDAAEAVGGFGDLDPLDVADLLGALVDKSLVVAEQSGSTLRYGLLEMIREFAAERLAENGASEAGASEAAASEAGATAAAYRRHFLALAETAAPRLTGPDQRRWLARLTADHANLWRAARQTVAGPDATETALRFTLAIRDYALERSIGAEFFALAEPLLTRPDARDYPELFGHVLAFTALSGRAVDVPAALKLGEQAIEYARQRQDDALLAEALSIGCSLRYFAGQPEIGTPLGEEALRLARPLGDDGLMTRVLSGYLLCVDLTDPERAGPLYAEAIACTERTGDMLFGGSLHNNAAVHAMRADDFPAARAHLESARRLAAPDLDYPMFTNLGWLDRHDGDLDSARVRFEEVLRYGRRTGERAALAYAFLGLACLATDTCQWQWAAALHGAAQAALDQPGEAWQDPEGRYRQASLDAARAHLGEETFEQEYARGAGLTLDEAFGLATGPAAVAW